MTTVTASHQIVREACFQTHGSPEVAIDIALARLREHALGVAAGWGRPFPCQMHFKLEVEKPERPAVTRRESPWP